VRQTTASTPNWSRQMARDQLELGLGVGAEAVDADDDRHAELRTLPTWRPRLAMPRAQRVEFLRAELVRGTPPCIFSARTVATITAAAGDSPALRHLMSKNFSAPRSAPKPASVTT
jgi:hypothetical protein